MAFTKSEWETIDAIVFDAVGTLIEPFPSVAETYAQTALRQGVVLASGDVKTRFHAHFRNDEWDEIRGPMATDEAIEVRRWRRIVANVLPEVPDLDRAFDELWLHFGQPQGWRCFPEVATVLQSLTDVGRTVCIASNFDARLRGVAAGLPPLAKLTGDLVISSEVGFRKPHPAFYRAACEHLGLAGARVLWVGDDVENDVAGPIRAGLRGLWLDRHGRGDSRLPQIRDLTELLTAV
ncbi:MAG: HAD-IA family hydrolase [Isosphaeraceae bacterium]|nr:HAD-IA family hydrolase [Isosphaeraceae bacterium]